MSWNNSNRRDRLPPWWNTFTTQYLLKHPKCAIKYTGCLGDATDVDHIIPGDDHSEGNLQPACSYCHDRKSSKEGNAVQSKMRSQRSRPRRRHPGDRY